MQDKDQESVLVRIRWGTARLKRKVACRAEPWLARCSDYQRKRDVAMASVGSFLTEILKIVLAGKSFFDIDDL